MTAGCGTPPPEQHTLNFHKHMEFVRPTRLSVGLAFRQNNPPVHPPQPSQAVKSSWSLSRVLQFPHTSTRWILSNQHGLASQLDISRSIFRYRAEYFATNIGSRERCAYRDMTSTHFLSSSVLTDCSGVALTISRPPEERS